MTCMKEFEQDIFFVASANLFPQCTLGLPFGLYFVSDIDKSCSSCKSISMSICIDSDMRGVEPGCLS